MKKMLFILLCTSTLFIYSNHETQASPTQIENVGTENWAPLTRAWYETMPMTYQGTILFVRKPINQHCMEGYLSPKNIGFSRFVYEGWLYPCEGNKPIPTLKPVKAVDE